MIIALTRIRNEELIIQDTLRHMAKFAGIIVYDDDSTDRTLELVETSDAPVLKLIRGTSWSSDRQEAETQHRSRLVRCAADYDPNWLVYMDADERFAGDVRAELDNYAPNVSAVRFPLLDAYLSSGAADPYREGELSALYRLYGPEVRHIVMAWRPSRRIRYLGRDQREPILGLSLRVAASAIPVKHFGKGISVAQWEDTCIYYMTHFPEPYKTKWALRRGQAMHSSSDFGRELHAWPVPKTDQVSIDPHQTRAAILKRLWVDLLPATRSGSGK